MVTLVIPCYNEEAVLPDTLTRLLGWRHDMVVRQRIDPASRLVFVDDGSRDRTWSLLAEAAGAHREVAAIRLSRNRGHQNALLAGLSVAEGDALVSIDADLQDDINAIDRMIERYEAGFDTVYGVRRSRGTDTAYKRLTAAAFYRLMRALGTDTVAEHADFRLLSRRAVEALKTYREVHLFLRGLVPLIGYPSCIVHYDRKPRAAGESKYPTRRMLEFALDAVTSFSAFPLRMISMLGFSVFTGTLLLAVWVLWVRFVLDASVPGWASILLPLSFLGGLQLLALGVIGEYLGKLYLEAKGRPRYFIEDMLDGDSLRPPPE